VRADRPVTHPPSAAPWLPEVVVDAALARDLVAAIAPTLATSPPTPLGAGWDNTAWVFREAPGATPDHAPDAWVFRFPRRTIAVRCMETELAALPALAPHLPLAVPTPVHRGTMPNGWPFGGYRLLPGVPLATATDTSTAARMALAARLGDCLGALHALPADLAESRAPDPLGRLDVDRREAITLTSLEATQVATDRPRALIATAREAAQRHRPTLAVSHGDLDARHILVTDDLAASGIIDWGDLMVADPAIDLGVAFSSFAGPARTALLEAYAARGHALSETTLILARFRALTTSARILTWAIDIGDLALAAWARGSLAGCLD